MAYKKKIAGITIELDADTSKLVKALDKASKNITTIGKKFQSVGRDFTKYVTVPVVGAATTMAAKYADVDKTMTLVNETMGNTEDQANLINKAMESAASNSIFGMSEAATATLNFARAGLTAEQAAATLAPAMNLAAGEGGNLDTVSKGLVATINGFQGSFDEAGYYADVFANACNNSALDVDSLSDAMGIAAPVFKAAGYTIDDAALYMGIMANNGIEAGEAANALKTGMARLVDPAKEGAEWMEKLGINIVNSDGSMKDSVTVQAELHDAFANLSESEQIAAASAIFGKNQMSKWLALINTAPNDVNALNSSIDTTGTTTDMANAMMSGYGGSIERLKSSIDVLMVSMGRLIAGYIQPVVDKLQAMVDKFQDLDDESKKTIIKMSGIAAAIGPVLVIFGKLIEITGKATSGISGLVAVFSKLGGASVTTAAGANGVTAAITGISAPVAGVGLALAALAGTFVYLYNTNEDFRESINQSMEDLKKYISELKGDLQPSIDGLKESFGEFADTLAPVFEYIVNDIIGNFKEVSHAAEPAIKAITNVVDFLTNTVKAFSALFHGEFEEFGSYFKTGLTSLLDNIGNILKIRFNGFFAGLESAGIDTKDFFKLAFQGIKSIVTENINSIADKITSKLDNVKNKVSNFVQSLKNLFNFEWSLPHFELPHFHIYGGELPWGIGGRGTPPEIRVDWYAKAMDNAYMLNGASIFGAANGKLLGGGEKGSEMIIGTNKLLEMISKAKGGDTIFNNQFTINGTNMDPEELAHEVSYYMNLEMQRMNYAQGIV